MEKDVRELVAEFREAAIGMGNRHVPPANTAVKKVCACYEVLRSTKEGRDGLLSLIEDENPAVRLTAAGPCLHWAPEHARPVLEELRESDGLWSFQAKWTLIEFDKGRRPLDQ